MGGHSATGVLKGAGSPLLPFSAPCSTHDACQPTPCAQASIALTKRAKPPLLKLNSKACATLTQ